MVIELKSMRVVVFALMKIARLASSPFQSVTAVNTASICSWETREDGARSSSCCCSMLCVCVKWESYMTEGEGCYLISVSSFLIAARNAIFVFLFLFVLFSNLEAGHLFLHVGLDSQHEVFRVEIHALLDALGSVNADG